MKSTNSRISALLLLALASCSSTARHEAPPTGETWRDARSAHETILRWMDARSDGDGALYELAGHADSGVRERAVRAIGRLPFPRFGDAASGALRRALEDADPNVRGIAAFGAGLRADPGLEDALLAAWHDEDEDVRARVVEAAGKLATPRLREEVLFALQDASLAVRIEAATAPHRWSTEPVEDDAEGPDHRAVDTALVGCFAKRVRIGPRVVEAPGLAYGPDSGEEDAEVIWRALFTLQRRSSQAGRRAFLAFSRFEASDLARLYAVKGLARIEPDEGVVRALEHGVRDPDWRIAVEALTGLKEAAHPASLTPIEYALTNESAHVRAAAYSALGAIEDPRVPALLERAHGDLSTTVRSRALIALARLRGAEIAPDLEAQLEADDPLVRMATAEAFAELSTELAVPYLARLARDRDVRVAGRAIDMLARHPNADSRDALHRALEGRDNGLRLAAVNALSTDPQPTDLPLLARAYTQSRGDVGPEVRFNCLKVIASIGGDDARTFLRDAVEDPHPYVRSVARAELSKLGLETPAEQGPWIAPYGLEPFAEAEANPRVEISTNRGTLTFELFADEAPGHVQSFLELAAADHYDGLTFHRVVPDFVVQGGCYRGDGNGARPARGDALRHEIGPRKYARGSLGMPRNEDWESGGSQIFVTHRPTPHLDGRYTIFGELRSGSRVLDTIEIGDVILDVRVLD